MMLRAKGLEMKTRKIISKSIGNAMPDLKGQDALF